MSVGYVSFKVSKVEKELAAHMSGVHGSGNSTETKKVTSVLSETEVVGVTKLARICVLYILTIKQSMVEMLIA